MRILVYGAGVIGGIFAGKLYEAGHDVTMLARGNRYVELAKDGLILEDVYTKKRTVSKINMIEKLEQDDCYDYILVVMQKNHVGSVLASLKENCSPNIVFVVNNALGYEKWANSVGGDRLMIGFPSAGGERTDKGIVRYFVGKGIIRLFQTTTFGEYDGTKSKRVQKLIEAFNQAGIPSVFCHNMDAWQKHHVAIVTCIANALYKYDGNNYQMAKSFEDVRLMLRGIKEGFSALKALGYSITPLKLNYFLLPNALLLLIFKPLMGTKLAEITMSKHAMAAINEMKCLQDEFDLLASESGVHTSAINELKENLDYRCSLLQ